MNDKLKGDFGFDVGKQSLDVVQADHPLSTLAVDPTPWNICPVCKSQADVDDDASDGSQIRCHECKADLVVVEFGNPDGSGSAWELHVVGEKEGVAKTSTPVDAPDIVERCAVAFWECEWPTRSHAKFADESEDTREGIKGGVRAIIAELAAMGGEAPNMAKLAYVARAAFDRACAFRDADPFEHVVMRVLRANGHAPILSAKSATIAEQARALTQARADIEALETGLQTERFEASQREDALTKERSELRDVYRRAVDALDASNNQRDAALAEVARLKALLKAGAT